MNTFSDRRLADFYHIINIDPIHDRLKKEFARKVDDQVIADVITLYLDEVRNRLVKEGEVFIPFIGTIVAADFSQYPDDVEDQLAKAEKVNPFSKLDIKPLRSGCFLAIDKDDINTVNKYLNSRVYKDRMRDLDKFCNPKDQDED